MGARRTGRERALQALYQLEMAEGTSSSEALDAKGKEVLLEWSPEHMLEIEPESGEKEGAV